MKRLNPESFRFIVLSLLSILAIVFLLPGCTRKEAGRDSYKLVSQFRGQLWWWQSWRPMSVAVNFQGDVFVVGKGDHRVQKFTADGAFMNAWGSHGSRNGAFDRPHGIAVDKGGNIYVTDTYNHRIQKFDPSGTFISKWGNKGAGAGQFNMPTGIAVDTHGNVYVGDSGNYRIQKFDDNGRFSLTWGKQGSDLGEFKRRLWLAVDTQGYVFVSDEANQRIQKFDSSGGLVTAWGGRTYTSGKGKFAMPTGVAVDTRGNVYVADFGNHRIQKFTNTGEFLSDWNIPGSWRKLEGWPYGVAVNPEGTVYVTDPESQRLLKFAPSSASKSRTVGPLIGKWRCEGQVVTLDDGSQRTIPYSGDTGAEPDLELFDDGRYLDTKEGIQGQFAVLDANHIQFKIIEARRLPKGLSYINEFNVSRDKLTLSITKNPLGIRRIDIVYARSGER